MLSVIVVLYVFRSSYMSYSSCVSVCSASFSELFYVVVYFIHDFSFCFNNFFSGIRLFRNIICYFSNIWTCRKAIQNSAYNYWLSTPFLIWSQLQMMDIVSLFSDTSNKGNRLDCETCAKYLQTAAFCCCGEFSELDLCLKQLLVVFQHYLHVTFVSFR